MATRHPCWPERSPVHGASGPLPAQAAEWGRPCGLGGRREDRGFLGGEGSCRGHFRSGVGRPSIAPARQLCRIGRVP